MGPMTLCLLEPMHAAASAVVATRPAGDGLNFSVPHFRPCRTPHPLLLLPAERTQGNHSVVASVTEGQRLNLFDVEKRDLLRTCSVGFAALAVHISPIPLPNGSRSNAGGGRFANLMGVGNKGGPGGRNNPNGSSHHIAIGGAGGRLKIVVRSLSHLPSLIRVSFAFLY